MSRAFLFLVFCILLTVLAPTTASASFIVGRNAQNIQLAVNAKGWAMVSYTSNGTVMHVLARGAVNANQPKPGGKQTAFQIDWAGGWGWQHQQLWKSWGNTCKPYDGPGLPFFVTGCKAPDGSYWALQQWQRALPDLGFNPWTAQQSVFELHLSHWTGQTDALAKIEAYQDWVYGGRYNEIFGKVTYKGVPVHGYTSTNVGGPRDPFGRNLYLDTLDAPAYGPGLHRENSFLAHNPTGAFCYGLYPFDPSKGGYQHPPGQTSLRGPGIGAQYRLTMIGPGVTPDVQATVQALHPFNKNDPNDLKLEQQMNQLRGEIAPGDRSCHA
jgi:hypothetical protein